MGLAMGLMVLVVAYHGGSWGILAGLTKSTDHPNKGPVRAQI